MSARAAGAAAEGRASERSEADGWNGLQRWNGADEAASGRRTLAEGAAAEVSARAAGAAAERCAPERPEADEWNSLQRWNGRPRQLAALRQLALWLTWAAH